MSEVKFAPFQKVLVRDSVNQAWSTAIFGHKQHSEDGLEYICSGNPWVYCIPYEGNEHLLGTINSPTPPKTEFKFGDKVAISHNGKDWQRAIYVRKVDGDMPHEVYMQVPWHYGGQEYHVKFCRHEEW